MGLDDIHLQLKAVLLRHTGISKCVMQGHVGNVAAEKSDFVKGHHNLSPIFFTLG